MNVINLKCISNIHLRCLYNLETREFRYIELSPQEINVHKIDWAGEYEIFQNNLYALSESTQGPIFIVNNDIYFLRKNNYKFFYSQHSQMNKCSFKAIVDGKKIVDIVYDTPGWCDAFDDIDFGHWVTVLSENDYFIEGFTKQ